MTKDITDLKARRAFAAIDFCPWCRKQVSGILGWEHFAKTLDGQDYSFKVTIVTCKNCGRLMSPPGLIDFNIKEYEDQLDQYGIKYNKQRD